MRTLGYAPRLRNANGPVLDAQLKILKIVAALGIVALAASIPTWTGWAPVLLFAAPAMTSWAVRRASLLVSLYLAQVSVYFGVTWLILRQERPPELVVLVVIWSLGAMVGGLCGRPDRGVEHTRTWAQPRWPQFLLTMILLAIQASLVFSSRLGYEAQLTLGLSTPTGTLGILAATGPIVSLLLLVTALGSEKRVAGALILAVIQTILLSLSGFRGAGVIFLVASAYMAVLMLPKSSPWRSPKRVIAVVPTLFLAIGISFSVGAQVKDASATQLGVSSQGTQLFGFSEAVNDLAVRLDLSDPLQQGILYQDDPGVRNAVSWETQIAASMPRFLWPDKPVVDYGQNVSVSVYGLRYGQSASTVTAIGDTLINFGLPGVVLTSLILGYVLARCERSIRSGIGMSSLVAAAVLSYSVVEGEGPLILSVVGVIRSLLVVAALWWGAAVLNRKDVESAGQRPATRVSTG